MYPFVHRLITEGQTALKNFNIRFPLYLFIVLYVASSCATSFQIKTRTTGCNLKLSVCIPDPNQALTYSRKVGSPTNSVLYIVIINNDDTDFIFPKEGDFKANDTIRILVSTEKYDFLIKRRPWIYTRRAYVPYILKKGCVYVIPIDLRQDNWVISSGGYSFSNYPEVFDCRIKIIYSYSVDYIDEYFMKSFLSQSQGNGQGDSYSRRPRFFQGTIESDWVSANLRVDMK